MRRIILVFILMISVALAKDDAGEQLLASANDLVNIRADGAKPLQLDINFWVQLTVPQSGHLTWKWAGKDLWSRQITMGDYRQLDVRKGDALYTSRNAPFTPLRIREMIELINVFQSDPEHLQARKVKQKTVNGVDLKCVEVRRRPGLHEWDPRREVCINPSGEVVSSELRDEQEYRREEFAGYQPFRDHRYPAQLKLFVNGSKAVEVENVSWQDATFSESEFVPPASALMRRQCDHVIPPVAIRTPDPAYPKSASQNRLGGTSTVAVTVLPDGSVGDVQLIGSAGHEMDQVSQEIIRTWKFKPAMCGNERIAFDITVEVNFRLE